MKTQETIVLLAGRFLLGLYFILPAIQKITNYESTVQYMALHSVPMIDFLLPLTILLQVVGGVAIIIGFQGKIAAFILAGLTLVISIFMHNFWNLPEGGDIARETQNFVKNMAIMAGLLVLAGRGCGQFSVDNKAASSQ